MSGDAFGLVEMLGVFGLVLGALGWQWVTIRRTLRADREKADAGPQTKPSEPGPDVRA